MNKLATLVLAFATLLFLQPKQIHAQQQEPQSIQFDGKTVPNFDYYHGQLKPAFGVHNIQVLRANRERPELADNFGWTYNHAQMISYWNNTFYLEYLSNVKSEHTPPSQTLLTTSKDGYSWTKPVVIFPPYEIPEGTIKKGGSGDSKPTPKGMFSQVHQRMGFYTAKSGRHLVLAFYGISIDTDSPNDGRGIGRVVREINKDGTFGEIFFLRYNVSQGWNEKNTKYPFYKSAKDKGFVQACDELLADKLMMMQMWEEADRGDPLIVLNESLKAFSYYHITDSKVVGLWKWAKGAISNDNGKTWGPRVDIPGLVTAGGKIWGQKTSDGKYATVYNPTASWRWPLALSTSADGIHYNNMLLVHGEVSLPRYGGLYKDYGPAYVRGIEEGNGIVPDKNMWLTYSLNKEDIWVAKVPVPIIDEVTEQVNDVFNTMPNGDELNYWNIYSPVWAQVNIQKSADGAKCLALTDGEPNDYAKAQRLFPASKNFKIELELLPIAGNNGILEIEVQDERGTAPFRIVFDQNGSIGFTDGKETFRKIAKYEQSAWCKLLISCNNGKYTVSLNDEAPISIYAVFPTLAPERLVFRTGSERRCLGVGASFPYNDQPNVSDPDPNPAKYLIRSVKTSAL